MNDWLFYLLVFLSGGFICLIGQILIIRTKMTTARILVTFLVTGMVLEALTLFDPLVKLFGSGVKLPLVGFGGALAKGAKNAVETQGILGVFSGGLGAVSAGVAASVFFAFFVGIIFKARTKK